MKVKLYRGIHMDHGLSESFTVKAGTSIVFLTKAGERVFYALFYTDRDALVEIPATDLLEVSPE